MLEQALSCSHLADVQFVFDDGKRHVWGHRGMLSAAGGAFEGMFRSGMREEREGEVRVRGVSVGGFRGFLEYVYLGESFVEFSWTCVRVRLRACGLVV
jgi:hypothetical protein